MEEDGKGRAENPAEAHRDWCVYLLTCADGTLYCGVTSDLERRLDMHNGLLAGGAKYTRGRRPVTLTACADGLTRGEALRLEARVKKKPRSEKLAALLVEGGGGSER
ncbi:MAG: GIY-YIG nuclease family protein [Mailhella sp.]|nr:GIY-YIG nuclease family protein [Mailhella sp.]